MKNWIYIISIFLISLTSLNGQFVYYNPVDSTFTFQAWEAHWMQKTIEENKLQKEEIWNLYPYKDLYAKNSLYIKDLESQVAVSDSLNSNLKTRLGVTQNLYEECLVLKKNAEEEVLPTSSALIDGLKKDRDKQKKRKRIFQWTAGGAIVVAIIEFVALVLY